jgi:hypothetical protein
MKLKSIAICGFALATSIASATTLVHTFNFATDIDSFDGYGAASNVVVTLDMNAIFPGYSGFSMSGVGWDVTITSEGESWRSEAAVEFNNSTADSPDAIWLTPGSADSSPGTGTYSSGGIISFSSVPLNDIALNADNVLRMEFFETYDDVTGTRDGFWHAGGAMDLQFEATPVPEPASMAALTLGAAALLRRRRR